MIHIDGYTHKQLRDHLLGMIIGYGSQKACAKDLGVSTQYLNDVVRGRRAPGEKLLKTIGYKKYTVYVRR